jgi:hypothetical protein
MVEFAAGVGPASRQGGLARGVFDEAAVGHVRIALEGVLEVCRDQLLEPACPAAGLPMIDYIPMDKVVRK